MISSLSISYEAGRIALVAFANYFCMYYRLNAKKFESLNHSSKTGKQVESYNTQY